MLKAGAVEPCPFSFESDVTRAGTYSLSVPSSIRSQLGGVEGSVLDTFGGEYEWDNWTVRLLQNRESDTGIVLRYGKNITDIRQEESIENTVTGLLPFWKKDSDDGTQFVNLSTPVYAENAENYPFHMTEVIDFSQEFENAPTKEQLRSRAEQYIKSNGLGVPDVNISVSFLALWQTEDYKDIACLERVNLCDRIEVEFPDLGVSASAKVIKTEYDVLLDRYTSIEIGSARSKLSDTISEAKQEIKTVKKDTTSYMQIAISHATKMIQGGLGGHVVVNTNAAGQPNEILVMDTEDKATAVNVIRMNVNGIGFSTNGYNGPYKTAWTIDGTFDASFITAGTLLADRIKGGTLTLGGENDVNGEMVVVDANGKEVGVWSKDGIYIYGGDINGSDITIGGSDGGALSVLNSNNQLETLLDENGIQIFSKGVETAKLWSTYDTDTGLRGVSLADSQNGYYLSFGTYNSHSGGLTAHTRYYPGTNIAYEKGWFFQDPIHLIQEDVKFVDSRKSGNTVSKLHTITMDGERGLSIDVCTDKGRFISFGHSNDEQQTGITSRTQYYTDDSSVVTEEGWYVNCNLHLLNELLFVMKGKYSSYNGRISRVANNIGGNVYEGITIEGETIILRSPHFCISDGSSSKVGYTGDVSIGGRTLTFMNGILVGA